jgi:NAD(P)-dependent dehydrogenase (short-subunit alcohol dehydrogenase family)
MRRRLGGALAKSRWRSGNVFSPLAAHPRVVAQLCDVRDPESVAASFAAVKREFGAIDILVNNAGVTQPMLSTEETGIALWNEIIATDLTGVFLCTWAALPLMRMGGTIINNISAAAKQVFPKFAAYTAAKHSVLGFTLSLREELIPRGVRVVAFMPGGISTNLWDHRWPQAPRERMIDPTAVAEAILFAVSLPPQANLSEFLVVPTSGAL